MPRLFVIAGPDIGRTYDIDAASTKPAALGRGTDCEVQLRGTSISRTHARLERSGDEWFIVDAGSRNGVQIDGRRVEREALRDGMQFKLGDIELRFRLGEAAAPTSAAPDARMERSPRRCS